jgi:hypothetical protein
LVPTDDVVQWIAGTTPLTQRYTLDAILANWLKAQTGTGGGSSGSSVTGNSNSNDDTPSSPATPNSTIDSALPSPRSTASVTSACSSPLPSSATSATVTTATTTSTTAVGGGSRSLRRGSQRAKKTPSPVLNGNGNNVNGSQSISPIPWSSRSASSGSVGIPHLSATASPSSRSARSPSSSPISSGVTAAATASMSPLVHRGVSPTILSSGNRSVSRNHHTNGNGTASNQQQTPTSARSFWVGPNPVYPTSSILLTPTTTIGSSSSTTSTSTTSTKLESPAAWRPNRQPQPLPETTGLSFSISSVSSSPAKPSSVATATPSIIIASPSTNTPTVLSSSSSASMATTTNTISTPIQTKAEPPEHAAAFDLCSLAALATTDSMTTSHTATATANGSATTESGITIIPTTVTLPAGGKENVIPSSSAAIAPIVIAPSSPLLPKKSGANRRGNSATSPSLASASNGHPRAAAVANRHVHRKSGAVASTMMTSSAPPTMGLSNGLGLPLPNGLMTSSMLSSPVSSTIGHANGNGNGNGSYRHINGHGHSNTVVTTSPAVRTRGRVLASHATNVMPAISSSMISNTKMVRLPTMNTSIVTAAAL